LSPHSLSFSFCICLLIIGTGCARAPASSNDNLFAHESIALQAPDGLTGGIWALIDADPVYIGGRLNSTGEPSGSLHRFERALSKWTAAAELQPGLIDTAKVYTTREGILVEPASADGTGESRPLWLRRAGNTFEAIPLPPFPSATSFVAAASGDRGTYVFARQDNGIVILLSIPLADADDPTGWRDHGRTPFKDPSAAAIQAKGDHPGLYVLAEPAAAADADARAMWHYDFRSAQWTEHAILPAAAPADAAVVTPAGIAHLYAVVQDTGRDPSLQLAVFNNVTRTWAKSLPLPVHGRPVAAQVQGTAISALLAGPDGATLLVSHYLVRARGLHPFDYTILAVFILSLFGIAWLHSKMSGSADHYFRGGRNVNWLAAGIAIVATRLSSTSFVAIPAKAFATNLQYALIPVTNLFGAFVMTRWFVKFFVRLNVTSGYEYLEKRFTLPVRMVGSLNYLLFEIARIGLLIVVPSVVLASVARVDLNATILTVGIVATLYTVAGGIKGVVWADTFQIVVKVTGLIIALISVFFLIKGDLGDMLTTARQEGKLRMVDWSWDLTRDTIVVFVLFWFTDGLKSYVANQIIIQQFISTRDEGTAKRSIWTSAILGVAVTWLLLLIGVGLYLFYRQHPERFDLMIEKPDGVFPWFIVFELPPGVVGILVAALIAAAMSSLDQALLSSSTVMVIDFYRRFNPRGSDATALRLGRCLTVVMGIFATTAALYMSGLAVKSLVDQTLRLIGLFGGGLGGLFLLGMLTTRASAISALCGLAVSVAVQYYVSQHTPLHLLTYMFTGMTSCFITGYLLGFVFPERKPLEGLTIHTTAER
jgi:SSS family transporter